MGAAHTGDISSLTDVAVHESANVLPVTFFVSVAVTEMASPAVACAVPCFATRRQRTKMRKPNGLLLRRMTCVPLTFSTDQSPPTTVPAARSAWASDGIDSAESGRAQAIRESRGEVPLHGRDAFRGATPFASPSRTTGNGWRPLLAETFCDVEHSTGTCYKAAWWTPHSPLFCPFNDFLGLNR